jgi:K(+)-stimulated pyrophosphate-energized sodium pump
MAAVAQAARYRLGRRFGPLRDMLDALRGGSAATVTQGLGAGLQATGLPMLAVGAAMLAAWQLGAGTDLPGGGLAASLTALMAMLGAGPFMLAMGTLGPIAGNARGVAAMTSLPAEADPARRSGRLDDAGYSATTVAQTYFIVVGCLAALCAAAALPALLVGVGTGLLTSIPGAVDVSNPAVVWSGAVGAVAVLGYAGSAARQSTRCVRSLAAEVGRQLRGFPRERGIALIPRDYTPTYRTCIELATRTALQRILPVATAALLLPAALGIALGLLYSATTSGLVWQGLTALVVFAAVTGLGAALAVDGTRGALTAARRANRPRSGQSSLDASVAAGAVADVMGSSAGPAAYLLVKATAVSSLAVATFLL